MASLPTERQVLTALINSITSISPPPAQQETEDRKFLDERPQNALSRVSGSARPLLMTLHVIFPSLVLPALDLLDRQLVTKLVLQDDDAGLTRRDEIGGPSIENDRNKRQKSAQLAAASAGERGVHDGAPTTSSADRRRQLYLVRSGQTSSTRKRWHSDPDEGAAHGGAAPPGLPSYLVHLDAWNCSCAGFAFSAFPIVTGLAGSAAPAKQEAEEEEEQMGGQMAERSQEDVDEEVHEDDWAGEQLLHNLNNDDEGVQGPWEFGGFSAEGETVTVEEGGDVEQRMPGPPCCKHLLACLLADRWGTVLKNAVIEREVSRIELAGIVADI